MLTPKKPKVMANRVLTGKVGKPAVDCCFSIVNKTPLIQLVDLRFIWAQGRSLIIGVVAQQERSGGRLSK